MRFTLSLSNAHVSFTLHYTRYLPREPTSQLGDPIVRVFSFVGKALYDGYNVLLASPTHILSAPIEGLVEPDADIAYPPTGTSKPTDFLYLRSRGRTFQFASSMAELLKASLQTDHVAPYSWREQELIEAAFNRVKETTTTNPPQYGYLAIDKGLLQFRQVNLKLESAEIGNQWVPLAQPNCTAASLAYARTSER